MTEKDLKRPVPNQANDVTEITEPGAQKFDQEPTIVAGEETTGVNTKSESENHQKTKTSIDTGKTTVIYPPEFDAAKERTPDTNKTVIGAEGQSTGTGNFSLDQSNAPTNIGGPPPDFSLLQVDEVSAIGESIGEYEITEELGRGGMGVVYKARHKQLRRDVALKMILNGAHTSKKFLKRFVTEARAVAALQHPNIVQLFDFGEHAGLPYFTLEFVDGQDLQRMLKGEPQTAEDCARMVESLARAMHYAHGQNIVHRDLKPANVLVGKDGTLKITDFGLARDVEDESQDTRTGTVMGSPSYMSPEQAEGRINDVGPASDQYSLGAVLYQLITARAPFAAAKTIDTITQVVKNDPIPPRRFQPEVPIELETICLKTLQKDPASRYANCEELAEDLRRYLAGEPIKARPASKLVSVWKWCKRNPFIAWPSAASLALLLTTAIVASWSWVSVSAANTALATANQQVQQKNQIITKEKEKEKQLRMLAEENEQRARKQAELALGMFQRVITKVDPILAPLPNMQQQRLGLMKDIETQWNEIDKTVRDDDLSQAVPTLMAARLALMNIYTELGEYGPAKRLAEAVLATARGRVKLRDGTTATRYNLALILQRVAAVHSQTDPDRRTVISHLLESQNLLDDCRKNPKKGPDGKITAAEAIEAQAATNSQNLGVAYLFEGNLTESLAVLKDARESFSKLIDQLADQPAQRGRVLGLRISLAQAVLSQAYVKLRMELPDESLELYRTALAMNEQLAKDTNNNSYAAGLRAGAIGFLGEAWHWMDQFKPAEEKLTTSVEQFEKLYAADKKDIAKTRNLATAHYRLGCVYDDMNNAAKAKEHFSRSLSLYADLVKTGGFKFKQYHMKALARVGEVEAAQKLASELNATSEQNERKQLDSGLLWIEPNASVHVMRAQALAQVVRHLPDDQKTAAIDAAFKAIDQAIASGYRDPYKIRVHSDFEPLHSDPRFAAAVDRVRTMAARQ